MTSEKQLEAFKKKRTIMLRLLKMHKKESVGA